MTRVIVSAEAETDITEILGYLAHNAGRLTAAAYGERFADAIERLAAFSGAAAPRPALGPDARITIVYPYVLIYDFTPATDTTAAAR